MTQADLLNQAKDLSVPERLELIDNLIESVECDEQQTPPAEIKAELDLRYQEFLANPGVGESWEVVRERIQRSLDASRHHR